MKCPIDQVELVMSERQGVEIDYCPTCRGVWLDRGELDKIIDRVAAPAAAALPAPAVPPVPPAAPWGDAPVPAQAAPAPGPDQRYRDDRYRDEQHRDDVYRGRDERYDDRREPGSDPRSDPRSDTRRKKKDRDWLTDLFDFG